MCPNIRCITGVYCNAAVLSTVTTTFGNYSSLRVFTDRYVTKCEQVIDVHNWTASSPHNRETRQLKLALAVALEDVAKDVRPS
jgi:hypothetical protein